MKNISLIISVILLISCTSSKNNYDSDRRCKKTLKNNFNNILIEKFESIINNDTIHFNEVKYECVHIAMYTHKGMYDKFGKWYQEIYPNQRRHPILLWKDVKLFPNDTTEFIVATNGYEDMKRIYASVLVFDKHYNDLLSETSNYRAQLIDYFSQMIKSNNSKNKEFYEKYWMTVDPKYWEQIKHFQKN